MTMKRRIEALEAAHLRRRWAPHTPQGWTVNDLLDAAIAWLERPLAEQRADMPMFTAAELAEIRSWLPAYRRARWAGR